ncbi:MULTISPECIES: phosphoenolpyruvate-utilizing N-terminal domain-containing protein [Pelosinus]|uniref:phosphoenolpyruvate-utilizing N-terminal domain-containing protein n=1 Tax=Pelosinus TaxID=365348 RepID=UPI00035DA33E|nr:MULTISPECIES: phosphoenolpyruvate-utilizing N-terminal domain-containing protein [Pelosinus]
MKSNNRGKGEEPAASSGSIMSQKAKEKNRFLAAQQAAEAEIISLQQLNEKDKEGQAEVLAVHRELVSSRSFSDSVMTFINKDHANAEAAVEYTVNEIVSMLVLLENDYMRQRAVNIKEIGNRLLRHLRITKT